MAVVCSGPFPLLLVVKQHRLVRQAILDHLVCYFMIGQHITNYSTIEEYTRATNMNRNGTWGSDIEIMTASHMLNTTLCMYDTVSGTWSTYGPLIGCRVPM